MGGVEQSRLLNDRQMLRFCSGGIPERHPVAAKFCHVGAGLQVKRVQDGLLEA